MPPVPAISNRRQSIYGNIAENRNLNTFATPDTVRTDYSLPRYSQDGGGAPIDSFEEIELVERPHRCDSETYSLLSQQPSANTSMVYGRPAGPGPLPAPQRLPNYGELDLVSRKDHLKQIEAFRAGMEGNLFTSSLTRLVAIGGTAAGTTLGVLICVRDAAHAYTQQQNGQPITVFSKPQHQNLLWEVPLGLAIYLSFMAMGLYRQYSVRAKIKGVLKNDLKRSKHLSNEMLILLRGNHPQREEVKEIRKIVKNTQSKLGYTPGADTSQILKGTLLSVPITIGALIAIGASLFVCGLAAMGAAQGGCGDGCGGCGGDDGGCSCNCSGGKKIGQAPVQPTGTEGWETVMNRPLNLTEEA